MAGLLGPIGGRRRARELGRACSGRIDHDDVSDRNPSPPPVQVLTDFSVFSARKEVLDGLIEDARRQYMEGSHEKVTVHLTDNVGRVFP